MRRLRIGCQFRKAAGWAVVVLWCAFIYRVIDKQIMMQLVRETLPVKEAGLLLGIVLGDKGGLGVELMKEIKNSGVLHLVVVSGSNVILVAKFVVDGFSGWLDRRKTIIMALVGVWSYAALVGWQIPIIRAVWLVTGFYWSQLLGRKFDAVRFFALTLGMMLIIDWRMIFELSFWLTTMAFVGVLTVSRDTKSPLMDSIKSSVWITLWVIPILSLSMGKINLLSPVTTTLMMLVAEGVTVGGLLVLILSSCWLVLGKAVLWMIFPLLKYGVWVVEVMGGQNRDLNIKFNWWTLVGCYLILVGWWWRHKNED